MASTAPPPYNQDRYLKRCSDIEGRLHRAIRLARLLEWNGNEDQQGRRCSLLTRYLIATRCITEVQYVLMADLSDARARKAINKHIGYTLHHMLLYRTGQTTVNNLPLPIQSYELVIPLPLG